MNEVKGALALACSRIPREKAPVRAKLICTDATSSSISDSNKT